MKPEDFMRAFSRLDVMQKAKTIENMEKQGPPKAATIEQLHIFGALHKWASVNLAVGDELAPPTFEHFKNYL